MGIPGVDSFNNPITTPVASATLGPAGELLTLQYEDPTQYNPIPVYESFQYNALLQVISMNAYPQMSMYYNYSSTQNNGRIASSNDYVTGEVVAYTYDSLNRLSSATSSGSVNWAQVYSYDSFGNLMSKAAPAPGVSYDLNNHQIGMAYDANGNQLWDSGQHGVAFGWNMENKLVTQTSQGWPGATTWYSYDPSGRRVMKDVNADPNGYAGGPGYTGGQWEFYFYGITGQKLVTTTCSYLPSGSLNCSASGSNLYFGSRLIESNRAIVVTDRLGSVRARTDSAGWTNMSYYPYGEERTSTVDGKDKFATYFHDGPGQDYAEQRYYGTGTGRFWSADQATGGSLASPTSLNRYAYVRGDPVNLIDPNGRRSVRIGCWVWVSVPAPTPPKAEELAGFGDGDAECLDVDVPDSGESGMGGNFDTAAWTAVGATTYFAKQALKQKLSSLSEDCLNALGDALGISIQKLQSDAEKLSFFAGTTAAGRLTVAEAVSGVNWGQYGSTTIQSLAASDARVGADATIIGGLVNGSDYVSNAVVLNANSSYSADSFFHELLHFTAQKFDATLIAALGLGPQSTPVMDASKLFNSWLRENNCIK
jgi:RHS repeat-associated protein